MSIFVGTLIVSAPELGVGVVVPNAGAGVSRTPRVGLLPYSDTANGVCTFNMLPSGSTVVCAECFGSVWQCVSILGQVNSSMDALSNSYRHRLLNGESAQEQSAKSMTAFVQVLEKLLPGFLTTFVRNHANGVDGDALPGDLDFIDKQTQVGLHLARDIASLRGSALASVDVLSSGNEVRITGDKATVHTIGHESEASVDGYVRNTAISGSEAFGLKQGPAAKVEGEGLKPVNEDALPFYRLQHMEGAAVDGIEDNVLDFPHESDVHDASNEPSVLSSRKQTLSGHIADSSSGGLSFIKTPFVSASLQVGYGKTPKRPATIPKDGAFGEAKSFDDLREPYEPEKADNGDKEGEDIDEDRKTIDAAINKLITGLLESKHQQAVLDVMARHGFSQSAPDKSIGGRIKSEAKEPGGATTSQFYPLPPYTEVTDPVTGETTKHYKSLSFITQEPDGSICISDGYGSEIRMCRGNIYISPALDLVFRPGRHMYGMAPGYLSLNAQDRCDIASGHDTVSIKAAKDLKMAAGANDGDETAGAVTIESLSKAGGDIMLKSSGNLSAVASTSIVVGHEPGGGETCPVYLNAGSSGSVYIRGAQTTIDAAETTICGVNQQGESPAGNAIVVDRNCISLLGNSITAPTNLDMRQTAKTPGVTLVRGNKTTKATIAKADAAQLKLGGSLLVDGSISVNGHGNIHSINTAGLSEIPEKHYNKHDTSKNLLVPTQAGYGAALTSNRLAHTVYSSKYINDQTFRYPAKYNINMDVMPGMRWQDMSRASGNPGSVWVEPEVNHTKGFPGKGVWGGASLSSRGYKKDLQLDSGYITNVKNNK